MTEFKVLNPEDTSYHELVQNTRVSPEELLRQHPKLKEKIDSLLGFFQETGIKYDEFDIEPDPEFLKGLKRPDIVKKKAYPNIDPFQYIPGAHDIQKWLNTVKEVYFKEKNGMTRVAAIRAVTSRWNPMETYDFLNWLRFYESGSHLKYKTAQLWYENGAPGYYLPIKKDQTQESGGDDLNSAHDMGDTLSVSEKKRIIEKQRSKIIGRLDSAEKLLRTHDGQLFAGKEFESLLETIYNLKKKIQMVNKISTSTKLYEDLIIRESNILNKKGFVKAAQILMTCAQANNPPPEGTGNPNDTSALAPSSPTPPTQGVGSAGGLPSTGPGMAQTPPESAPNETSPGIAAFLENLETANIGKWKLDNQGVDDEILEVSEDVLKIDDSSLLVVEAQEAPLPTQPTPTSKPIVKQPPATSDKKLEVEEDELTPEPSKNMADVDHIINSAFANIRVEDIINKLEEVGKIFKVREIPRQLSFVDMMCASKGLSAFLPELAEAVSKSLEANNYILIRIDDTLSKLRGGVETKQIDLTGEKTPKSTSPEIDSLINNLQLQEEKEKNRKKKKQEQQNKELDQANEPEVTEKETPEVDIAKDLAQPIPEKTPTVPKPAPTPVK